ncbi:hypothetical protein CcaverHIS002_0501320 [Cutaneotrichosporon cavernicola]|uniref:S-adenosyl-L-methionine-dependent methyltransferase n=1 Tax=Cutaneotrichosporon cavernicola TaxID=279322 RepID=A0AA48QXL1_9TREE|nr:uncharacterized protein CcaverHIS019_0601330 [Cutaneotrichosporon cavernicola]BEI84731.1 hypothetical protein CcaverHIS002_0501320 [Cutaneotrichosporon cavernicola]BEI93674.1 hypothetical protein CcaverHIS019_0601330 [Cutaneotrichosporon cavernicola]BEJ01451.1 hypothetical protein CcaverHIS631_0601330 [Cutaneotrichosporon cavernicola]BEJ09218.1 hypothetical protein CcaverHIS641_0601330 [Cutaneotrichosporon cavernicola]
MAVPANPGALFVNIGDAVLVEDVDEEIMDLYIGLEEHTGGLGYLDGRAPELSLVLDLVPPAVEVMAEEPVGKRRMRRKEKAKTVESVSLDVVVTQDPGALRARSGETGSVLWRSSFHLARHILTQLLFPTASTLLSVSELASAKVLELGAGTGVLASLIGPLAGSYIATDRRENLKLVQRNVDNNASAAIKIATKALGGDPQPAITAELDWEQVSAACARARTKGETYALPSGSPGADADLVLAVDCIYNEHLVQPLVDTLAAACVRGAVAWVVVEKRSPDVLRHFLDTWQSDSAGFTIVRLGDEAMGRWEGERGRWVGWIGWTKS